MTCRAFALQHLPHAVYLLRRVADSASAFVEARCVCMGIPEWEMSLSRHLEHLSTKQFATCPPKQEVTNLSATVATKTYYEGGGGGAKPPQFLSG